MEILQLKYFFESAKNENFAKTAEKFMVPTSSVSASVKRLEKELGCKLFDRSSNRITLNSNGKKLQQSLCIVFAELDNVIENLAGLPKDEREITMLVRAVRSDITDYIAEYSEKNPHMTFKTVFDFNETEYENYDIIIDEKTDLYPEYESFELFTMKLRMKVSSKSPLCKRKLTLKQLCNQNFISWGDRSNMHRILITSCKNAGFTPNVVVHSNDTNCYEKLIECGMGIGLSREKTPMSKNTEYLDISDFVERYTIYCYYRRTACYGNVEHFLNFLRTKSV